MVGFALNIPELETEATPKKDLILVPMDLPGSHLNIHLGKLDTAGGSQQLRIRPRRNAWDDIEDTK